jgi:prolycopene isomerase
MTDNISSTDYDVIVIGTGMGGSAAGAISALNGCKTLILEKNPRPGGSCSYYEKDGFQVDAGTHLFIRGNKGPFGVLTRRLGVGTPINFIRTDNIVHLRGMNVDVIVPKSKLAVLYKFVIPKIMWQTKIHPKHYPGIVRLFLDIARMKEREMETLDNTSVHDFMLRYTDNPEIRNMIGMLLGLCFILPPWEASAGESVWNLQKLIWEDNLSYPQGGAVAIPKTFLKGAEQHGAQVRLKAGVKAIDVQNGRATGVILENGERLSARAVICTSGVKDTVNRLVGPDFFPPEYVARVNSLTPSWTATQAKIGVRKKLVAAGSLVGGVPLKFDGKMTDALVEKIMGQLAQGELLEMLPLYIPIPSNYDPALAPPGCQLITAVAVAPTLEVDWQVSQKEWMDAMMDALYEIIPGLKENIIFCDTWSVKALASWIGKDNGSAITTGQSPDQVRHMRPPHETPITGLYLAGDCAGPSRGVGTELACQSGMDCGDRVSSHIYNHLL